MKKLLASVAVATALVFAAVASAQFTSDTLPPNHHVHDCTKQPPSACQYPHLAVGFFPHILGDNEWPPLTYLRDPAVCNDATDKALLPPNDGITPNSNQPLRAGVCHTSTTLIHMRSIDANDPAPEGWLGPIAPVKLANGVTYVTYWLLTPR
jgi:hypothetical protein